MTTREEQRANRKLWIDALRSKEYKQGSLRLKQGDRFCCLGVATDLFGVGWKGDNYMESDTVSNTMLSDRVREMLGLATVHGGYMGRGFLDGEIPSTLMMDNDIHGKTFEQIADIIESCPRFLLVPDSITGPYND